MRAKIKVCGMKYNIEEVAALKPDYIGFIFYEDSPRNFDGTIPKLPSEIKKVGVFVNQIIEKVVEIVDKYSLDVIQLHGEENVAYCKLLSKYSNDLEVWNVFSVGQDFNFEVIRPYEPFISKFLFDTKGIHKGGNGVLFNWEILSEYTSQKEFILSGGIGLKEIDAINKLMSNENLPLHAIDINSKFEDRPGLKNITRLKQFFNEI